MTIAARLREVMTATGLAVALLIFTAGHTNIGTAAGSTSAATVDRAVYAALATDRAATFLVYLAETADLTSVSPLATKAARGAHVRQQLRSVAGASQANLRAMLDRRGVAYTSFWIANALLVTGDRALVDELAARPDVAAIEPDREVPLVEPVRVGSAPDARTAAVEWGVSNIRADQVWSQFAVRGQGIVVANIDTGVQFNHPALVRQYRGNTGAGFNHHHNWFDPTGICGATPCDNNGHGTHTMGTMAGDDGGANQIGVAPAARWIAAKGCAANSCDASHLLAAGQWMLAPTDLNGQNPRPDLAPDVVNNSWGGGQRDLWYQATINAWISAGIFPVFSIGNSGPNCNTAGSPGDNVPAYGVGAYNSANQIASFSSRGFTSTGTQVVKPNLAAPGVDVRSAFPTSTYTLLSGTSMAAPHVAGTVALIWSAQPALHGNIAGTRTVLDGSAVNVDAPQCRGTVEDNHVFGEGRLDALAAVTRARAGGAWPIVDADFRATCSAAGSFRTCSFSEATVGSAASFHWNFGDGGTSTQRNPTRIYPSVSATYQVTLTVTGTNGVTDTITKPVNVP